MTGNINVKARLIRGERSREFFGVILWELARGLPTTQTVVVGDSSHTVPGENPAGFQSVALPFLGRL